MFEAMSVPDLDAREDAEYRRLVRRWQLELDRAQQAGDELRQADVRRTLHAAHLLRQRQLALRADPGEPPF